MNLHVTADYREMSRAVAHRVAQELLRNPDAVLALPTGDTPRGMYQVLVRLYREGLADFSRATAFNLDEYLDIPPHHPESFAAYMHSHLWSQVNLAPERAYIPDSATADPDNECLRYEELMAKAGGVDLAVLGIGPNGHIGFNEPGTPWDSITHVASLTLETRRRQARAFGGLEQVPQRAITMGIKTIMRARVIVLLASGAGKAKSLDRALAGSVTPEVPASVLQLHPMLTVVADRAAARGLVAGT